MKNAFDGFISRLDMAEERISELPKLKSKEKRNQKEKLGQNSQELRDNYQKQCTHTGNT